jgi:hypothetical protein
MGLRGRVTRVLWATAAAAMAASAQDAARGQVLDRIAVVVGNTVITEREVMQEARLEAFLNQTPADFSAQPRRAAAERLVNQQLVRNEMSVGAYPEPSDAEVEGALRGFRQEHFASVPQYRASLQQYGLAEDQLKQHLRWQLAAMQFTDMRFTPSAPADGNRGADRIVPRAGTTARSGQAGEQDANRAAPNGTAPPAATNTDDAFETWLKQARGATKIQFKPGAFQ